MFLYFSINYTLVYCYNYNIYLLEFVPETLICTYSDGREQPCYSWDLWGTDPICEDPTLESVRPDTHDEEFFTNWALQMDMYCWNKFETGMFGTMPLIGSAISCIFLCLISQWWGRKPILIVANIYTLLVFFSLTFFPQTIVRYICLFLLGFTDVRAFVAFLLVQEYFQQKHTAFLTSAIFVVDCIVSQFLPPLAFYLLKRWEPLYYLMHIPIIICCVLGFLVLESP